MLILLPDNDDSRYNDIKLFMDVKARHVYTRIYAFARSLSPIPPLPPSPSPMRRLRVVDASRRWNAAS